MSPLILIAAAVVAWLALLALVVGGLHLTTSTPTPRRTPLPPVKNVRAVTATRTSDRPFADVHRLPAPAPSEAA